LPTPKKSVRCAREPLGFRVAAALGTVTLAAGGNGAQAR